MELINAKPSRAIGTLGRPTKDVPVSTLALEKLSEFQTLRDPQLKRMQLETARFITAYKRGYSPRWLSLLRHFGRWQDDVGKRDSANLWRQVCDVDTRGKHAARRRISLVLGLIHEHVVILDDIGSEYATPFIAAKLLRIFVRARRTLDVITCNLSLADIGNKLDVAHRQPMLRAIHESSMSRCQTSICANEKTFIALPRRKRRRFYACVRSGGAAFFNTQDRDGQTPITLQPK